MSEAYAFGPPRLEPPDYLREDVAAALGKRLAGGALPYAIDPGRADAAGVPKMTIVGHFALFTLASDRRHSPASLRSLPQPASWLHLVNMTQDDGSPSLLPYFFVFSALQDTGKYRYASAAGAPFTTGLLEAARASQRKNAARQGDYDEVVICVPSLYLLALWQRFEDPAEDTVDVWRGPREIARRSQPLPLGEFCDALDRRRTLE